MNRILLAYPEVSPVFLNGGIGTYVYEAAMALSRSGKWEVDILTDTTYGLSCTPQAFQSAFEKFHREKIRLIDLHREDGIPCAWDSADVLRAERYHRHVLRLHQERHYDVIEFPDWRAPGFFIIRDKRTLDTYSDCCLLLHCHSSTKNVWDWFGGYFCDRNDFYCNYMENYAKKYCDAVLSPSEYLLQDVRPTLSTFEKPLFRNGYPISSSTIDSSSIRNRSKRKITIACVSRLERRKGQDVLAHAIRRLVTENSIADEVEFVFCGKDGLGKESDGPMSVTLRRILGDSTGWKIIPPRDRQDLLAWLSLEVDICIVPSRQDNYPNVVLEAARAGCYVIASNVGGIPEIFQDYEPEGSLISSDDDQLLEKEIRSAIQKVRNEPEIRRRLCAAFEERRRRHEEKTVAVYEEILRSKKSSSPSISIQPGQPSVSVIIPFYNAQAFAGDAIRSAFHSDYKSVEVILVNDGSDQPEAIQFLKRIETEFPALKIIHKENGGLGDARNAALRVASGEYIVPLDSDNILLPGMLRTCSRVLTARPALAYVTTYYECLNEDGSRTPWRYSPIAKPFGAVDPLLLLENPVGDALSMIRRKDLEEVKGYSTSIYCFEDWDVWLKFHSLGKEGDVIPEVLFLYRLRKDSMSRRMDAKTGLRVHQALLNEHLGLLKNQSFEITTLLLKDYWERWRQNVPPLNRPSNQFTWRRIQKGIKDPVKAWRFVRKRISNRSSSS